MRKLLLTVLALSLPLTAAADVRLTFYLSPQGDDGANGLSAAKPLRTFERAFSVMDPGDELVLLDGVYGETAGTGYVSYAGLHSGQPPSGRPELPTVVRARHPGSVKIIGGLFLGRSFRADNDIVIQGLTFEGQADGTGGGAGVVYSGSRVTIRDCGFHGVQPMASAILRLEDGAADVSLEDIWVWGRAPAGVAAASAKALSARRLLIRMESGGQPLLLRSGKASLENALSLEGDAARWLSPSSPFEPWPDEDQIRQDLCVDAGVSRGFCSWDSLSRYLKDVQPAPLARIMRLSPGPSGTRGLGPLRGAP